MIVPRKYIKTIIASLREFHPSHRLVFTNGCFDIIHPGHIHYLKEAKKMGTHLMIGLNSDNSIKTFKGSHRPILNHFDRAKILDAISNVDIITIFDEPDPLSLIKEISPNVLVKGGDWKVNEIIGKDFVESKGGIVKIIGVKEKISSTEIIDRCFKSELQRKNK